MYLTIKSAINNKMLTGCIDLSLESAVDPKYSWFAFDKSAEVGGRKKGKLYREDGSKKKLYLYFNGDKKNAVLHKDSHPVFITQINDLYTISDVDNNCLSEKDGKVQNEKCKRGKKNQRWQITFSKEKDIITACKQKEKSSKKAKRDCTEFKESLDVFVEPTQDTSKREHRKKKIREKKAANYLVEKSEEIVKEKIGDKENIKEKNEDKENMKEDIKQKNVEVESKGIVSTTVHSKTTETITKLDVVTEYLPEKTTKTIKIPVYKILPPVIVQKMADTSIEPSVQVEETLSSFKVNSINPPVEVQENQANLQITQPEVQQNIIMLRGKKNSRVIKRKKPKRVGRLNSENEISSSNTVSLYTEESDDDSSRNLYKTIPKKKKKGKKRVKNGEKTAKSKKKEGSISKTRNDKTEEASDLNSENNSSPQNNSNVKTSEEPIKQNNLLVEQKPLNQNNSNVKTSEEPIKQNNLLVEQNLLNHNNLNVNTKNEKNCIVNEKKFFDYDTSAIKNVIRHETNNDNEIFDFFKLSDFSNDLKGTNIEEIIGLKESTPRKTNSVKCSKKSQIISKQIVKLPKNYVPLVKTNTETKHVLKQKAINPTIKPQTAPIKNQNPPQATSLKLKSRTVIKQPFKVISKTPHHMF
ncbi:hypothetical protein NGRA_0516 [Nosema granulosis]|uniref:Uncharacterized protein n=1 Tax=Nosema granulosis TaxID=83296 RepID=A0A9P6H175_9MICR|nr:hypothetical protein NGRA_0516 [Nosema granulosis]